MRRRYDEFEIEIRSVDAQFFEARVLAAASPPEARAAETFDPPLTEGALDATLKQLTSRIGWESSRRRGARDACFDGGPLVEVPKVDPKKLGEVLFSALFRNDVRDRFIASHARLGAPGANPDARGLLLRISFDHKEDLPALAMVPWEFMHHEERALALDDRTPIVRSVLHGLRTEPLRVERLKVLLVTSYAGPKGLNIEAEVQAIRKSLEENEHISVTVVRADLAELRGALQRETFHILHYIGHGDPPAGPDDDFALLFEGGAEGIRVQGGLLAEHIRVMGQTPHLVVLNSCWGGAFPRLPGQDPFSGVAAELVRHQIAAVVAMQQPIADDAAITFSSAFYKGLAEGLPLGAAMTEGRIAIRRLSEVEWATPVLYLAADDDLFDIGPVPEATAPAIKVERGPLYLEIRSFKDPHPALRDRDPDDRLDLTEFFGGFENRFILDSVLWHSTVLPKLLEFLAKFKGSPRPLVFDFAAHTSLAFATGYCLDGKSGLDITLLQKSARDVQSWHAGPITPESGPFWQDDRSFLRDEKSDEVALSLGVTWEIEEDVSRFLDLSGIRVGRHLAVAVPEPSLGAVKGEAHALQLAHSLVKKIRQRSYEERESVLHLFAAAPNSLLFFLGQNHVGIGTVQLYEHDPKQKKPRRPGEPEREKPLRYEPSLRLPPVD